MSRWTPPTIHAAIRVWAQGHGRAPLRDDFCRAQGLPSVGCVLHHCGSLADARMGGGCAPGRRKSRSFAEAVAAYLEKEAARCDMWTCR